MVYFPVLLLVLICLYFILYKSALKLFKHSCLVVLSTPFLNTPLKLFKHSCLITAIFILFYFILFHFASIIFFERLILLQLCISTTPILITDDTLQHCFRPLWKRIG